MSYLIAAPEFVSAAATDLANIGETLSQANAGIGGFIGLPGTNGEVI